MYDKKKSVEILSQQMSKKNSLDTRIIYSQTYLCCRHIGELNGGLCNFPVSCQNLILNLNFLMKEVLKPPVQTPIVEFEPDIAC